jgi:hypothetical protein
MQDQNDNGTIDWIDTELANEFKALEQHEAETETAQEMEAAAAFAAKHEALHAMLKQRKEEESERERRKAATPYPTMSSLIDTTEEMELYQLATYVYDLKRALLCNEALDDIKDYGATEARCHFYTALSNLELASHALRLANVSLSKAKRN